MGANQEKVYFSDTQGHQLCGIIASMGSAACVIITHGYGGDTQRGKDKYSRVTLAKSLHQQGIDTLRYDHFGCGESEGKVEDLTVSLGIDGVVAAIRYCHDKGYEHIGLYGSSFGGLCVLFAALQETIRCICVLAPVGDYMAVRTAQLGHVAMQQREEEGTYMFEGKSIPYTYVSDAKQYIIAEHASELSMPVLIMHGDQDDNVPLSQSEQLLAGLPQGELVVFAGEGHSIKKEEHKKDVLERTVGFMKKYL